MRCACVENHGSDADNDEFGCGSEWLFSVSYNETQWPRVDDAEIAIVADDTFRYWNAADDVTTSIASSLTNIQTWIKTRAAVLTAIIGVIGLSGVLAGRDTIQSLPTWAKILLGIGAAIALAANAVMVLKTNTAETGTESLAETLSPQELRDADLVPLRQADQALIQFRRATAAAVISVLAATGTLVIFLFTGAKGADPTEFKVTVNYLTALPTPATAPSSGAAQPTTAGPTTTAPASKSPTPMPSGSKKSAKATPTTTSSPTPSPTVGPTGTPTPTPMSTTTFTTGCGKVVLTPSPSPTEVIFTPHGEPSPTNYPFTMVGTITSC